MATPNKSKSDWIALLEKANASRTDPIPKGFKPMDDWLEEFEISETTWRRRLPIMLKAGVMVCGHYRVHGNGRTIKKPFWKVNI